VAALLASRWARARADIRDVWPALLCGVVMALVATLLLMSVSPTGVMNTVAAIAGDSLGFYGCIWIVMRRRKFREGEHRSWRTTVYMVKLYWFAEIIDNVLRGGILAWTATFVMAGWPTTLVGNLLADIVFMGIAVFTGENFSDWCMRAIRSIFARCTSFQASGDVRFRLVAALVSVFLLGLTAIEPAKSVPATSIVEAPRVGQLGPVTGTEIAFVP
jgi:hypothetical protein